MGQSRGFISADYGSFRNIIGGGKKTTTGEQEAYNTYACKQKNPFKKTILLSMDGNKVFYDEND
jgi:uncharacterized protein YfdQ (DUF2303 family)